MKILIPHVYSCGDLEFLFLVQYYVETIFEFFFNLIVFMYHKSVKFFV